MKTFETEKHSIPEGVTHYRNEDKYSLFTWLKVDDDIELWCDILMRWRGVGSHVNRIMSQIVPIPQTNIETPEEKEALDLIDTTPHQYEMSKFSGKPRAKVEHVKCDYGDKVSNIVMDFENNAPLYKMVNDEYWSIDELDNLFGLILDGAYIYRRIETPMTEREEFIDAYAWAVGDDKSNVEDIAGMLFDSGKFKLVESN